jgi:hypothetical protein
MLLKAHLGVCVQVLPPGGHVVVKCLDASRTGTRTRTNRELLRTASEHFCRKPDGSLDIYIQAGHRQ